MNTQNLEQDLANQLKHYGGKNPHNYRIRNCVFCGKEYIGGTTSKKCPICYVDKDQEKATQRLREKRKETVRKMGEKCAICEQTEKLEIHHIDKNRNNNGSANLLLLCKKCHKRIHGKIYNPLFKRFFLILANERFSYEEIGKLFGTTRQNVYKILK